MSKPLDRDRLAKLCGLFSSEHAGERASAAAKADELVRQAGLRWPDLLAPAEPERHEHEVEATADVLDYVLAHAAVLTRWEREFAHSVRRQPYELTGKQRRVVERLISKVQAAARMWR